jgi:chromosomal replication initiation ATPase DnaA
MVESPLEKGKGHGIVGDPVFIENVLKQVEVRPTREQPETRKAISQVEPGKVLAAIMKRLSVTNEEIMERQSGSLARSIAMELLYRHAGMNQREIGEMMGVDYSTVSVARKRLLDRLTKDRKLQKRFAEMVAALSQE